MVHLDAEQLAGQALGLDDLTAAELDHLAGCGPCGTELGELRRTAQILRNGRAAAPPAPGLWQRIEAELATPVTPERPATPGESTGGSVTAVRSPTRSETQTPRRTRPASAPRRAWFLLAAAVGLIVGVGGTILVGTQLGDRTEVVSRTVLTPLPGKSGTGTAELVSVGGELCVRVSVEAAASASDYRELWLLDTGGKQMYSLGVLPASGGGTYPVPSELDATLKGFTVVDVSLEPYDGDSRHSANSLVRGVLPT